MSEHESDLNTFGGPDAPILVVCDSPSESVYQLGLTMSHPAMKLFAREAKAIGLSRDDFWFITCSPAIPEQSAATEGRINAFVDQFRDQLMAMLGRATAPRLLIYLGKTAARMIEGRSVAITKARGVVKTVTGIPCPVLPMLSPTNVLRRPEVAETFISDFRQIQALQEFGWNAEAMSSSRTRDKYRWVTDLQFLLDNPPKVVALDTETDGLKWAQGALPLLATLSYEDGSAIAVPLDIRYWPELGEDGIERLRGQLRTLLANPEVHVVGHNLKFDLHILRNIGIEVANWYADTVQLAFCADENMLSKGLADCVRRWVPEMSSYSDDFDKTVDKSRMLDVSREDMLPYACGDAEVSFTLAKRLVAEVKRDHKQWNVFHNVHMPALRMFVGMEERGLRVDRGALTALQATLEVEESSLYAKLIQQVPGTIKLRHLENKGLTPASSAEEIRKVLSFSRDDFTRDILFGADGFRLKPLVFTDTTAKLPEAERIPSVSTKTHLPYFSEHNEFVRDLIAYQRIQKMRSTYVGKASAAEYQVFRKLKNGKLPKAIQKECAEAGVELTADECYRIHGFRHRAKRRMRLPGLDQEVVHRIPLNGHNNLCVDVSGNLMIERLSDPTGFWKYLGEDDYLHPSFYLHDTNTGRANSRDPNAQNFPKRGSLAKAFRRIFIPPPGYGIMEIDLSQAELRVAAWMANETTMIRIYREGGDIHSSTAAAVMGIPPTQFDRWKQSEEPLLDHTNAFPGSGEYLRGLNPDSRAVATVKTFLEYKRFQAKAVNFGFLYGMGWRKFKDYAKTDYGVTLSDDEAGSMRTAFFRLYPGLAVWHKEMRLRAQRDKQVRALHGALRRLPSIDSDDEAIAAMCQRQAINAPVQRFASDLALMGLCAFVETWDGDPDDAFPVAFIHDAGVLYVREAMRFAVGRQLKSAIENQPLREVFGLNPPLPILSDLKWGPNLADMEDMMPEEEGAEHLLLT